MPTPIKDVCFAASVTLSVTPEPEILTTDVTLKTSGKYLRYSSVCLQFSFPLYVGWAD